VDAAEESGRQRSGKGIMLTLTISFTGFLGMDAMYRICMGMGVSSLASRSVGNWDTLFL